MSQRTISGNIDIESRDEGYQLPLMHFIVVWVITSIVQVPIQAEQDVYHPENKPKTETTKTKAETKRLVCAKEFATKKEAEDFIAKAPSDVKTHMHLINEDE